jgi:hypothetical protein
VKRNKIRYQNKPKDKILIQMTGEVYLQYQDDEAIEQAGKGDLMMFAHNDALHTTRQGDYGSTGFAGYFKIDVHDGWKWCPVILNEVFTQREHYFGKTECPIDTYHLCLELLKTLKGKSLLRTYREHYELDEE